MREFFQLSGWTEEAIERLVVNGFGSEDENWGFEEFARWIESKGTDKEFAREDFKSYDKG